MQSRTKLEVDIFKKRALKEMQTKWSQIDSESTKRGRYGGNSHISSLLKIGHGYMDDILNKVLDTERAFLIKDKEHFQENYFVGLTAEICKLLEEECNLVRSMLVEKFVRYDSAKDEIRGDIGEYQRERIDTIMKQIELLKQDVFDQSLSEQSIKVSEKIPAFDFIQLKGLKLMLIRDYNEIIKCLNNECWKAAIILSGSSIEAILYDKLKQREEDAKKVSSAPKNKKGEVIPLEEWRLNALIDSAEKLGFLKKGVKSLSHSGREYRNLVHPTEEIKGDYKLQKEEAENAFTILKIIIRDMTDQ